MSGDQRRADRPFFSLIESKTRFRRYQPQGVAGALKKLADMVVDKRGIYNYMPWVLKAAWATPVLLGLCATIMLGLPAGLMGAFVAAGSYVWGHHQFSIFMSYLQKAQWETQDFGSPPAIYTHPFIKTNLVTFNQIYSFAYHNNTVWYALRAQRDEPPIWEPMFIKDLPKDGLGQVECKADGENFMIRVFKETESTVYYKKVLGLKRRDNSLLIEGKAHGPFNTDQWFTLPIVRWLNLRDWGKRLSLASKSKWAMSHTGALRHKIKDGAGRMQSVWGATTVYEVDHDILILHDPYVPPGLEIKISLPSDLMVKSVEASSSHLLVLATSNKAPYEQILLHTNLDYDVLGLNPLMRYTDDKFNTSRRCLPMTHWSKIPMPKDKEILDCCLVQSGMNHALELRLLTHDGLLYQTLGDKEWDLASTTDMNDDIDHRVLEAQKSQAFEARNVQLFNKHFDKMVISHYDHHALNPKIFGFNDSNDPIIFNLQKSTNLICDFLKGTASYAWRLTLDPSSQNQENQQWFKSAHHEIQCTLEKDELHIIGREIHLSFEAKPRHESKSLLPYHHAYTTNKMAEERTPCNPKVHPQTSMSF